MSAPFVLSAMVVLAILIAVLVEIEYEGWATTCFSVGAALALWVYKGVIWDSVSSSPMTTIYFALSYIAAGLVWSVIKWKSYIGRKSDEFNERKSKFIANVGPIVDNWKQWIGTLRDGYISEFDSPEEIVKKIIPQAGEKKSLIVSWISYWPLSLAATLLNNPFRKFFEWIYSLVSGIYDKMGASEAKKMMSGFEKPVSEPESEKKPKK